MITQSRLESMIETNLNILSGFIVSFFLWSYIVGPLYGIETDFFQNLGIVFIFTISAVIRGYLWRRYFNRRLHQRLHKLLGERNDDIY